jgi:hypothetical protein
MTPDAAAFLEQLRRPPAEFGAIPFWFWNDDLDGAELLHHTVRMSWLLTDCEHVCRVAVVGAGHNLPWQAGENTLEVRVTNSAANCYEGAMRPSGLLGPVTLRYGILTP